MVLAGEVRRDVGRGVRVDVVCGEINVDEVHLRRYGLCDLGIIGVAELDRERPQG